MTTLSPASTTEALVTELRELLAARSVRRGDFTLASGAKSNYYFDCKATILSPRGAWLVGEILFRMLLPKRVEAVGGMAVGCIYIATAVSVISDQKGSPMYGFTVREKVKDHGTMKAAEESYHPDGKPLLSPGRRVAIVEDVVTKGGSVLKSIDYVREKGCSIEAVVALVDRQAGGADELRRQGLPFTSLFRADGDGNLSGG